jgi:osmotically-inducible protein OsmY
MKLRAVTRVEQHVMKPLRSRAADRHLQRDVEDALEMLHGFDGRDIQVSAAAGIVSLRGHVVTLSDKRTAGVVAAQVYGVKALVNDLALRGVSASGPTNSDIARSVLAALGWNPLVPKNAITAVVDDGWLTLEGVVDWHYQKHMAGREVRGLAGVRGVTNNIVVRPRGRTMTVGDIDDRNLFNGKMRIH